MFPAPRVFWRYRGGFVLQSGNMGAGDYAASMHVTNGIFNQGTDDFDI